MGKGWLGREGNDEGMGWERGREWGKVWLGREGMIGEDGTGRGTGRKGWLVMRMGLHGE